MNVTHIEKHHGSDGLVKVVFYLDDEIDNHATAETLWAIALSDGTYQIDNSPFSIYGVSYMDRIFAHWEEKRLVYSGIAKRGGHSTYRVKLNKGDGHEVFLQHWPTFETLGCSYEGADRERRLYSIDIPKGTSVHTAYNLLSGLETAGVWEFEEAHYFPIDGVRG